MLRQRSLGRCGILVSEIGFGTWGIGGNAHGAMGYGPTDDAESLRALAAAREQGCTFFDTSNLYGWGHAEELLSRAFSACRPDVVIAAKAGFVSADGDQDFSPDAIRDSLEGSLRRLRTDYVDLLQLHNPPPDMSHGGDPLFAELDRLLCSGKVRAIGISARSPDEALWWANAHPPDTLQVNFSLGDLRALQNGLFEACLENGIGVITRSPLAAGFLTGQLGAADVFQESDHRRRYPSDMRARWVEAVRLLQPVFADVADASPAQNAIRFCLSFDAVSTVIPGMMKVSEVSDDLAAAPLPRLQPGQIREVERVFEAVFE